ncbi:MAG: hypothetical protein ACFFFT_17865 [Candidatus Thorarchaeota archaeon]
MKLRKNMKGDSRPINLVLLAVSFIVFGVLGIVFMTQMELQPGWAWEEIRDIYPLGMEIFQTDDLNNNGYNDTIGYAYISGTDEPDRYSNIQYGGVFCLDSKNGNLLWKKEYEGPVKKVFPVGDVNNDGTIDFFVSKGSIEAEWQESNGHYTPDFIPNMNTNHLLNGINGTELIGYEFDFTNFYVHDLVVIDDVVGDHHEDLIMLEAKEYKIYNSWEDRWDIQNEINITSYFFNGTKTNSIFTVNQSIWSESKTPALELFQYNGQDHVLYIEDTSLVLLNTSESNFLDPIYNLSLTENIFGYELVKDVNLDNISEIMLLLRNGTISILDGSSGIVIRQFNVDELVSIDSLHRAYLDEIHSNEDGVIYFLLNIRFRSAVDSPEEQIMRVYRIDSIFEEVIWEKIKIGGDSDDGVFVLNEDMTGDSIEDLVYFERHRPLLAFNEVARFTIINTDTGKEIAVINTEFHPDSLITINDFDGDGKKDFIITGDDRIIAISSNKPVGMWLSPIFPLGLPLFIILVILLAAGIIIIILRGKRLDYKRGNIKEHKLTVAVNVLAIALITMTFLLFLILMNIFNNTLITGTNNTNIVIVFLVVIITWYGTLPLTAALYNRFAPQFAYIFIKLRDLFFKISKGYRNEIIVLDMGERKDTGLVIQLKRLILPLLLSISVGFYAYDVLSQTLGYPKTFETFGGTDFFNFMMGYMLCCVLPMILSFVLFSFFISGNFLLDDAGIVYYREHKKYRQPADIEPVSIWAQSIVKGIAGLSAILTFSTFLTTVDFSGFFGEGEPFMIVFGVLIILVFFAGIPFLTAFSYVLLAGEVMEMCVESNTQKLYDKMEKNGYDIKPREITNIYPSGVSTSEKDESDKI